MPSSTFQRVLTVLVTYLFIISSFAPFATRATPVHKVKRTGTKQAHLSAPHREGELLVRFRAGISQHDKETIIATHGARIKRDLAGESGVAQLELLLGHDARSVALQMLLSGQVEYAEPNFLITKD